MFGKLLSCIISFIFTCLISSITIAQPDFTSYYCDNSRGNYTISNTYQNNLNTTLFLLPISGNGNGFYTYNSNLGNETIYSVALCRGDVDQDLCRTCVDDSISKLQQICPNQKSAIGYYDRCMLKYSNSTAILRSNDIEFYVFLFNRANASDPERFNGNLTTLINTLISDASSGGDLRKFASGNRTIPDGNITIFALVQCTPDLSNTQCRDCLNGAFLSYTMSYGGRVGGRAYLPMCNFRYENYTFFNGSTLVVPTPPILQPSLPNPPPPPPGINSILFLYSRSI
ncbi:putative gnk2-like domain-containing protein [Tanacetum coccineum]